MLAEPDDAADDDGDGPDSANGDSETRLPPAGDADVDADEGDCAKSEAASAAVGDISSAEREALLLLPPNREDSDDDEVNRG